MSREENKLGLVASEMICGLLKHNHPFISEQELTYLTLTIQHQDKARKISHGIQKDGPVELQSMKKQQALPARPV